MSIEHPWQTLEEILAPQKDLLVDLLNYKVTKEPGAIIDEAIENNADLFLHTTNVASILFDEPEHEHGAVVTRAIHFAVVLNKLAGLNFDRLTTNETDPLNAPTRDEQRELITVTTQDFLDRNESLAELITQFLPEIDPMSSCTAEAEMVVALTMQQIERRRHKLAAQSIMRAWEADGSPMPTLDDR